MIEAWVANKDHGHKHAEIYDMGIPPFGENPMLPYEEEEEKDAYHEYSCKA